MRTYNTLGKPKPEKKEEPVHDTRLDQYKIGSTIGQGAYGKVKNTTHILTGEKVAIKFIEKNKLIRTDDEARINNEMMINRKLDHPNVLQAFEIFEDNLYFYMVMEKPEKGDLFNYICDNKRLTTKEATFFFFQIVNGIEYWHKNKIAHRDMKPENCLWTDDSVVKWIDFGLSKEYKNASSKLSTNCGSPCYSAPEMWKGNLYVPMPIDVWGLGVILYCMICGDLPFNDNNPNMLYQKVVGCKFTFPYFVNIHVKNLIKRIFVPNPKERITWQEIKNSSVYHMGKATFIKMFKIYELNGELCANVKEFIKGKVIECMKRECTSLINSVDIENTSAFKVYFFKFLHRTPWNQFYVPKGKIVVPAEGDLRKVKKNDDDNPEFDDVNSKNTNDGLLNIPHRDWISKKIQSSNYVTSRANTFWDNYLNTISFPDEDTRVYRWRTFHDDSRSKNTWMNCRKSTQLNDEELNPLENETKNNATKRRVLSALDIETERSYSKRELQLSLERERSSEKKRLRTPNKMQMWSNGFKKQFREANICCNARTNDTSDNCKMNNNTLKHGSPNKEKAKNKCINQVKCLPKQKFFSSGDRTPFKI